MQRDERGCGAAAEIRGGRQGCRLPDMLHDIGGQGTFFFPESKQNGKPEKTFREGVLLRLIGGFDKFERNSVPKYTENLVVLFRRPSCTLQKIIPN